MPESAADKKFWAFISYSSKDGKWGRWLHKRLENYPIPVDFQGTELADGAILGKFIRPIFRDRDELAGSADLGPSIQKALEQSRYLIVLCSPNSAKSEWVNKEIVAFKESGGERNILALILDGVPNATTQSATDPSVECFPPALRYPAEPLAGDLRREGDGKERGFLKVLSGIAQLDFDILFRRHERAQRKKRLVLGSLVAGVVLTLSALSVFAYAQRNEARAQRLATVEAKDETQLELAGSLLSEAQTEISKGAFRDALPPLLRAAEIYGKMDERPSELSRLLRLAVDGNAIVGDFRAHTESVNFAEFSATGDLLLTTTGGYGDLAVWDTSKWEPVFRLKLEGLCHAILAPDGHSVITVRNGAAAVWSRWSTKDGTLIEEQILNGFAVHHYSVAKDSRPEFYAAFNAGSVGARDGAELKFIRTEDNAEAASIILPPDLGFVWARFLPQADLILCDCTEKVVGFRSSTGDRLWEIAKKFKGMDKLAVSEDGTKFLGTNYAEGNRWYVFDSNDGRLLHESTEPFALHVDLEGLLFSAEQPVADILTSFGFSVGKTESGYAGAVQTSKLSASIAQGIFAVAYSSTVSITMLPMGRRLKFESPDRDSRLILLHPLIRKLISFDLTGRALVLELGENIPEPVANLSEGGLELIGTDAGSSSCLFANDGKDLIVWDAESEREITRIRGADDAAIFDYEWHPGVSRLLTISETEAPDADIPPQTIRVFDTATGKALLELRDSHSPSLAPDGGTLLVESPDSTILHPVGREGVAFPLRIPVPAKDAPPGQSGFSTDGTLVAYASPDGELIVQDTRTGNVVSELELGKPAPGGWAEHSFSKLLFHSDNTGILVSSNIGQSYMVDLKSGEITGHRDFQMEHSRFAGFHADEKLLACGSYSKVTLWNFPSLEKYRVIETQADELRLFPEEDRFLTLPPHSPVVFGSIESGLAIHTYKYPIAISVANGLIAAERDGETGTLDIIDYRTNHTIKSISGGSFESGFFNADASAIFVMGEKNHLTKFYIRESFEEILAKAKEEAPK